MQGFPPLGGWEDSPPSVKNSPILPPPPHSWKDSPSTKFLFFPHQKSILHPHPPLNKNFQVITQ